MISVCFIFLWLSCMIRWSDMVVGEPRDLGSGGGSAGRVSNTRSEIRKTTPLTFAGGWFTRKVPVGLAL